MEQSGEAALRGIRSILGILLFLTAAPCAVADDPMTPPEGSNQEAPAANSSSPERLAGKSAAPKEGMSYAGFWPSRFKMAVSYRGRFEHPTGRGFTKDEGDGYYLSRLRIEATLRLNRYVDLFAMTQDGRVFHYNDPRNRPSGMMDAFDLRQAYVDVHSELAATSLAFKIGRQYLNFGAKRLVGVADWSNSPPVFDAARLNLARSGMTVDLFAATRISTINAYTFNEPKRGENLYGAYLSFDNLVPGARAEPYLFWRTQPRVTDENEYTGDSDLLTAGFRFFGKLPHGFDYTSEVALQRGSYAADSVSAWAGTWGIGYLLNKSAARPRLLFEYNYATGDKSKRDGTRGTFDQLYAVNHPYYGIADQVGWRNTSNYKAGLEVQVTGRLRLQFEVNDFYLATVQDAMYADNGSAVVANARATSRHVGWEPDIQVTCKLTGQINIDGGYGRLFPGAFLKQSSPGHSYNFPYLTWDFRY